jgi:hypothetical protein
MAQRDGERTCNQTAAQANGAAVRIRTTFLHCFAGFRLCIRARLSSIAVNVKAPRAVEMQDLRKNFVLIQFFRALGSLGSLAL